LVILNGILGSLGMRLQSLGIHFYACFVPSTRLFVCCHLFKKTYCTFARKAKKNARKEHLAAELAQSRRKEIVNGFKVSTREKGYTLFLSWINLDGLNLRYTVCRVACLEVYAVLSCVRARETLCNLSANLEHQSFNLAYTYVNQHFFKSP